MGGGWSQEEAEASEGSQNQATKETTQPPPPPRSEAKLPHNYEVITKESDSLIDKSSTTKIYEQLHSGVFLNGKRKKYWVDKASNNCFMIFASGLLITWVENNCYWHWHNMETSEGSTSVAELIDVCWLEVHGRFSTEYLSPKVTYEVAYWIMLRENAYGWEVPVNFRLKVLGNGSKQEHKENLKEKPRNQWIQIPVGVVTANMGEVEFSLFEYEGGLWKRGLLIKGVNILPKI